MTQNRLLALALASVLTAYGQDQAKPAADRENDYHSNGLLEMSVGESGSGRSGLLAITLKNVSFSQGAYVQEWDPEAQYECEVLDAAGKPVPLTAEGEKLRVSRHQRLLVKSKIEMKSLRPGEQFTIQLDIGKLFQIKPKETYTVKVRRSAGLPDRGQSGKKLEQELRGTFVIPGAPDR